MNRHWTLVGVFTLACGPSTSSPETPAVAETKPISEAEQCLEDAQAFREPRPDAPESIEASHILVRHRDLKDAQGATRSREEACLRALEALQALQTSGDWNAVALEYNDAKNDVLGRVRADELNADFANAAFALEPNQLSYVVETNRGFHIILRKQ